MMREDVGLPGGGVDVGVNFGGEDALVAASSKRSNGRLVI